MQYGLIGEHLGHSYSPEIHALIGDYPYELHEVAPDALDAFMRARDFAGINVTIPYKQAVIPYLDELTERARAIGAVNTVVNRGRLIGDNTDFAGMKTLLERLGVSAPRKALVLGTGGTAKTAHAVLAALGAQAIVHVSRSERPDAVTYAQAARDHADADVLVNCTPVGMYPAVDGAPLSLDAFRQLTAVADAIYHPLRTNLVLDARERGIKAEGGLVMLAAQAVFAAQLFFGGAGAETPTAGAIAADPDAIERIFAQVRTQKENLVLIGMPGCGKSSVAARLAELTGRPVIDTDTAAEQRAGMSPADCITQRGEDAFRAIETAVVEEAAVADGAIIATGGGAILRDRNVRALARNGRLVFLDRALSDLVATPDRPLSSTPRQLAQLFAERAPRYRAVADCIIEVAGGIDEVAAAVWKEFTR